MLTVRSDTSTRKKGKKKCTERKWQEKKAKEFLLKQQ